MLKDYFVIISLFLAISFFLILTLNNKIKSKTIKFSFIILSVIYLGLILLFDNTYIYESLKNLITYFWYPNYFIFVTIILISILVLIYTLIKEKVYLSNKVINYFLFCIDFACYIVFLSMKIDVNSVASLYSLKSLLIMRVVTISFFVWLILGCIFKRINRGEK